MLSDGIDCYQIKSMAVTTWRLLLQRHGRQAWHKGCVTSDQEHRRNYMARTISTRGLAVEA